MMAHISMIRVGISLIMLGYTSWIDIKTREIYDLVWIIFGGLGLVLNMFELHIGSFTVLNLIFPIAFAVGISIILGYINLFGGADVMAFITLAILNPFPPNMFNSALGIVSSIYPITLISNSALSGVSLSLFIFIRNLILSVKGENLFDNNNVSALKKIILMFTGYRIDVNEVRGPPYHYPLEIPKGEGIDKDLVIMPDIVDDEAAINVFDELKKLNIKRTWISYTLPFLLFISIGYVLSLVIGDIALFILTQTIL